MLQSNHDINGLRSVLTGSESAITLIELLVVVALISITTAIMLPRFPELQNSFNQLNAQSNLLQDLKLAQAHSITEGCRGVIKINSDAKGYLFGCDYLDYDVTNPPSPDGSSFLRHLPSGITITTSQPVIFNSRGQTVDVNYILSNTSIALADQISGTTFATGTLLGTGVFAYD